MLQLLPELHQKYTDFVEEVLKAEYLSARDRALVELTSAMIAGDQEEVKKALISAKQEFITNEEIGQVAGIVAATQTRKLFSVESSSHVTNLPQSSQSECCR
ncbi:carboxymuconolactone decarboxylase family protein [Paenibacillus polymyxa]|uniref:carboxymuconolactone decarboxylase family protein n=1 Tax=Paenibacillus polymyxa TaxID=1406 RepID=UPI001BE655D2|nr:carboxymuconolactone decarboxylase family protein [Paenibacillus polymyxa]MBT2282490.1 carboxymuconolactone decarboxylase family protein [Paenibacillus polymyxa]